MPSYRRESTRRDENHVSAKETRGHLSTIPFSLARRKWRERKNLFRGKKYIVVLGGVFALPIHRTRAKKKQGGTRTAGVIVRCSSFFFFFFSSFTRAHHSYIFFFFSFFTLRSLFLSRWRSPLVSGIRATILRSVYGSYHRVSMFSSTNVVPLPVGCWYS